jgi:hypothetical protein
MSENPGYEKLAEAIVTGEVKDNEPPKAETPPVSVDATARVVGIGGKAVTKG